MRLDFPQHPHWSADSFPRIFAEVQISFGRSRHFAYQSKKCKLQSTFDNVSYDLFVKYQTPDELHNES